MSDARCFDCGRLYGDEHGFPDLIIPLFIWRQISPTNDEGGLLCPSCICGRLHAVQICCVGAFTSGPIQSVSQPLMQALCQIENLQSSPPPDRQQQQQQPSSDTESE